ncbi:MAG: aldo/keto reductase [Prolixibacteraceae bacterium]|nr:aldo/keto reductase [Prolixibacteraceae bacterium]MBT6999415.1 aldo/keto reductase [Prolixibacteraceae bacterium]MBT7394309.1 aldo/keto reductase [Prolixibacteraceae bacterium]
MIKSNMNRRKFVSALSMGTAHVLFSNPLSANSAKLISTNPLQKVTLGNSAIETTMLGIGTGVHAGNRTSFLTKQDRNKSVALLRHAYEKGIRMFDCADTYGTHDMVAEALQKMERENLMLSSKIWFRGGGIPEPERPDADIVVERFRKELNVDYLDMVQIHCMVDENWTETMKPQMDILENLKAKGIIRAHGVSVHSLEAMHDAVKSDWVDVLHARINPYGIAMDKPDPAEVVKVIHQLHKAGKGVIGMKLVGNGKLRDDSEKIDNSLRFVLGLGSVDMMIVGFEEKEQIDNYLERMKKALTKMNEG